MGSILDASIHLDSVVWRKKNELYSSGHNAVHFESLSDRAFSYKADTRSFQIQSLTYPSNISFSDNSTTTMLVTKNTDASVLAQVPLRTC